MSYNYNDNKEYPESDRRPSNSKKGGNSNSGSTRFQKNGFKKNSRGKPQFKRGRQYDSNESNDNKKRVRHNVEDQRTGSSRYSSSSYEHDMTDLAPLRTSRYEGTHSQGGARQSDSRYHHNRENMKQPPKTKFIPQLPKGPRASSSNTSRYSNSNNGHDSIGNSPKDRNSPIPIGTRAQINNQPSRYRKKIKPTYIIQKRTSSIYDRILQVGEGTYGKVYKAKNTNTDSLVALKKLRLQNEREGFPITSIREIKLLQTFDHPNVATIREIMVEQNRNIYMIFEYADNDLGGLLLNKNISISDAQKKDILKQLLQGCEYLHKNEILHRDIKGSNILVDNNGVLRITDFGLARRMVKNIEDGEIVKNDYTNRVITLWYRPPELLLGTTNYSSEVDMWGCGCLLVELFVSGALFQGTNELEQLVSIFKIMGTPTVEIWPNLFEMPWFFMMIPLIQEKYEETFDLKYQTMLPSYECFKMVKGLLCYNQAARLSATEALASPYFTENPQPEPLILKPNGETLGGCHEYEIKLARKQQKDKAK
ncbi:similar to Saccharomyces cerevisiae YKL139W CTK1 Catalytic (alpha) subunit of C-terminal domain kinase I (CTDK-I) [Maudiozyma barnettii]|uniref:[RNA-polymerase]-subunit kinase n=1 Tax=Maudiozyma barnettii TaxID=61262 RepID=A0A8H2VK91_9SACH|nr:cyclin-dependent serine/threonine protein kinase CTK1 [Kazachstania barnettii]CAB4257120.1 similar to Saccharomyces cerevisiae YKL139W CTK1 Catalytic (alpha) subunit of C-terminal domain kinase I (CTDK-I) [Kazachstania barnettii]CAD1779490.1 similar to Saccharomyces cerevisiae YKL139W CTK1 Catalytic (alpha) subunit of C-terminal domain kinase I (CTDK-I) [Kazachstania barnettii]